MRVVQQVQPKPWQAHACNLPFVYQICFVSYKNNNDIASALGSDLLYPSGCVQKRLPICSSTCAVWYVHSIQLAMRAY